MLGQPCPVCGAKDGACGDTPLAFAPIPVLGAEPMANSEQVFLPQQRTRRGVAGYRNLTKNTVVVDEQGKPVKQPKVITAKE